MDAPFPSLYALIDEATAAGLTGVAGILGCSMFALTFKRATLASTAEELRVLQASAQRIGDFFGAPSAVAAADLYGRAAALIEAEDARSRAEHTMEVAP